jgi:hypothetical protein
MALIVITLPWRAQAGDGLGAVGRCVVSLRDLEGRVRTAIAQSGPGAVDSVTLGNCVDVDGYRWRVHTRDVEILGIAATGNERPITAGQFADGLRQAAYGVIGMSLVPQELKPNTKHDVRVFPEAIRDSRTLALLTPADYSIKAALMRWLIEHRRQTLRSASATFSSHEILSGRVFFVASEPELEFADDGSTGWTVRLRAPVELKPAQDLIVDNEIAGSIPPDPVITAFCDDVNRRANELATRPVFRDLRLAYTLVLTGALLRKESVDWNREFWLSELQLSPYPSPRTLPAHKPTTLRHITWGGGGYQYGGVQQVVTVWGGVILGWQLPSVPASGPHIDLPGASVGQMSSQNRQSSWLEVVRPNPVSALAVNDPRFTGSGTLGRVQPFADAARQLLTVHRSVAAPSSITATAFSTALPPKSMSAPTPTTFAQMAKPVSVLPSSFFSITPMSWVGSTRLLTDFSFRWNHFASQLSVPSWGGSWPGSWNLPTFPQSIPSGRAPCTFVAGRLSC